MTLLIVYRYLIAAAGAITFAVAILASASPSSVWVPAPVSVVALFAQAYALYSFLRLLRTCRSSRRFCGSRGPSQPARVRDDVVRCSRNLLPRRCHVRAGPKIAQPR